MLQGGGIDYREALDYIWTGLTNYETIPADRKAPPDFRLKGIERFLERLGNPHRSFASIHIAGSKGKGSTAAMIASILHAAGLKVGLYISPHLHTFRERIRVASPRETLWREESMISRAEVVALVEELRPLVEEEQLTTFDFITAMGFLHFARQGVEMAVVEVGLGGRLDSTNVICPQVSVITSLSLEHTQILGDTLGKIASEKAGIIKEGVPVASARQEAEALAVLEKVAGEKHAPLTLVGRDWHWHLEEANWQGQRFSLSSLQAGVSLAGLKLPLLGRHQLDNAALAVAAGKLLPGAGGWLREEAIRQGLREVVWPGRLELVSRQPLVLLDGAHNADSINRLRGALEEYFPGHRPILVFGAMGDKEVDGMLAVILPVVKEAIFTRSESPRAALPETLAEKAASFGVKATDAANTEAALREAVARVQTGDIICVTGSLYLVAEAREAWARISGGHIPAGDA